jgi:hypothetical protein
MRFSDKCLITTVVLGLGLSLCTAIYKSIQQDRTIALQINPCIERELREHTHLTVAMARTGCWEKERNGE